MDIQVRVMPNAKKVKITRQDKKFKIYLISAPSKGKANKELIKVLSCYFNIPKSYISILKGETSRDKMIRIREDA